MDFRLQSYNPKLLRQTLRQRRRHLSPIEQHRHAKQIVQRIIHSKYYKLARDIAIYLPNDGEVDLTLLMLRLQQDYKKCYLPVILSTAHGQMAFAPYHRHTRLRKNTFNILEPIYQSKQLRKSQNLDLVLAPLVGFDEQGNRLGMGGGFYDRALQHLKKQHHSHYTKPRFVGVAHELQKVATLDSNYWDIPLHAIVTEKQLKHF